MTIYVFIMLILVVSIIGALLLFFRSINQQRKLHETILRSQNEKEIETYSRISGEYLHQNVLNGRILPHFIQLKELKQLVDNSSKTAQNRAVSDKIQALMNDLKQTESVIRHISENIFPPHLTYFFIETCQKRIDELKQIYPNGVQIVFHTEGVFTDLAQSPTLLYNLYSLIDLFVMNSLRHAKARCISISLNRQLMHISLDMADDGIGFDLIEKERHAKGRGLADFRGRAIILSPQYIFESELGKGTQFNISMSIQKFKK